LASADGNISTLDFPPREPRLHAKDALQAQKKGRPEAVLLCCCGLRSRAQRL